MDASTVFYGLNWLIILIVVVLLVLQLAVVVAFFGMASDAKQMRSDLERALALLERPRGHGRGSSARARARPMPYFWSNVGMNTSTRRFSWRPVGLSEPSAFSLSATGRVSP